MQKYRAVTGISVILLLFAVQLSAQLSPGDLSEPHAHLKGLSNCTKCHELGEKVSNEKCLACHLNIGIRIDEDRGYHASADVKGKECVECHSDHHGKKFHMIRFDAERFDVERFEEVLLALATFVPFFFKCARRLLGDRDDFFFGSCAQPVPSTKANRINSARNLLKIELFKLFVLNKNSP